MGVMTNGKKEDEKKQKRKYMKTGNGNGCHNGWKKRQKRWIKEKAS
jgi:hypothetical protein